MPPMLTYNKSIGGFNMTFVPITHPHNVDLWWKLISEEPRFENDSKSDWVGEHIFEIHEGNTLVGFISYSCWEEGDYCLSCVYILAEYRRKGYASQAIRKLLNKVKNETNIVYGFVHKDNSEAIKLYQKIGFKFLSKEGYYEIVDPMPKKCKMSENFYEFGVIFK